MRFNSAFRRELLATPMQRSGHVHWVVFDVRANGWAQMRREVKEFLQRDYAAYRAEVTHVHGWGE